MLLGAVLPLTVAAQEWSDPRSPRADVDERAARLPKPEEDLLAINAAFLGTVQGVVNGGAAGGTVFGAGSLDVTLTVRPTETFQVYVDVEGLVGQGPDQKLGTLSRVNKNADDILGKNETVRLMKLVLRPSWLEERVMLSFGKLDVEDYFDRNVFAEDEEQQFLNAALNTSPMLRAPNNGPGAALRVTAGDWRYAFGVHGQDDVFDDLSGVPFIIGEVGCRDIFALQGHYRLWARTGSVLIDRTRMTWAAGVSVDQLVTPEVGVFFRAAFNRDQGVSLTSYAWSVGMQVTPRGLRRAKDALGIGFSEQREEAGRERVAEAYYRLQVADPLALIANVQWIVSGPNTVSGGTNRGVVIPGLRALLSF